VLQREPCGLAGASGAARHDVESSRIARQVRPIDSFMVWPLRGLAFRLHE
jgi:hypothetical protein